MLSLELLPFAKPTRADDAPVVGMKSVTLVQLGAVELLRSVVFGVPYHVPLSDGPGETALFVTTRGTTSIAFVTYT